MPSVLVAYATGEGQSAKVARHVESVLAARGFDVTTRHVSNVPDVESFDAVVLGGPVNNRRHRPELVEFVTAHREALEDRPTGFFQLSMASAMPFRSAREGAMDFVDRLIAETGWRPDQVALLAGAVKYSQYGRFERALFRLVAAVTTGDTDTSRDYEYTDWDEVERFATAFAEHARASIEGEATTTRSRLALGLLGAGLLGAAYWWIRARRSAAPEPTAGEVATGVREEQATP